MPNEIRKPGSGYYNQLIQAAGDVTVVAALPHMLDRHGIGTWTFQKSIGVTTIEVTTVDPEFLRSRMVDPRSAQATDAGLNGLPWEDISTLSTGTGNLQTISALVSAVRITFAAHDPAVPHFVIINGA